MVPPVSTSRQSSTAVAVGAPSSRPPSAAASVSSAGRSAVRRFDGAERRVGQRLDQLSGDDEQHLALGARTEVGDQGRRPSAASGRCRREPGPGPRAAARWGSAASGLGHGLDDDVRGAAPARRCRHRCPGVSGEAEKVIWGPRRGGGWCGSRSVVWTPPVRGHALGSGHDEDGDLAARRPGNGMGEGRGGGRHGERRRCPVLEPDHVADGQPADHRTTAGGIGLKRTATSTSTSVSALLRALGRLAAGQLRASSSCARLSRSSAGSRLAYGMQSEALPVRSPIASSRRADDDGVGRRRSLDEPGIGLQVLQRGARRGRAARGRRRARGASWSAGDAAGPARCPSGAGRAAAPRRGRRAGGRPWSAGSASSMLRSDLPGHGSSVTTAQTAWSGRPVRYSS